MIYVDPVIIPYPLTLALRTLSVRLTRDGEATATPKLAMLLSPDTLTVRALFICRDVASASQKFLSTAVDIPHLLLAKDEVAPARAAARYPVISEDVVLTMDLNDGSGSGGGTPAGLLATVKVDGVPANRDIVALERVPSGEWRVAGFGATVAGDLDMDLRVAGSGQVYVVAMDAWGTVFQPSLNVAEGDLIRPTVFMGWIYRITQVGQLPAAEPSWWDDSLLGPQPLGTARAEVHRYYPPQGRGPIPVEFT
ncbi:hypothetical protein ACA097_09505 [Pseudomonas sp. QL9]|uniref:hypothetical protein n=1 Tax=Pseudomonas sp. QL9 TaxID=3242725 RepID=UPI00352A854B